MDIYGCPSLKPIGTSSNPDAISEPIWSADDLEGAMSALRHDFTRILQSAFPMIQNLHKSSQKKGLSGERERKRERSDPTLGAHPETRYRI
jgi:hypothetical protein